MSGSLPDFAETCFPLIRKVMPRIIAEELWTRHWQSLRTDYTYETVPRTSASLGPDEACPCACHGGDMFMCCWGPCCTEVGRSRP